jgi:predicted HNH restriction endonuclease
MKEPDNAFILRQSPSYRNRLESISLPKNVIINGWSKAKGLIEENDQLSFQEILRKSYYANEKNQRKAGYARGTMWRFLKEMKIGNWVVVPHTGRVYYVAEITGDAFYDRSAAAKRTDSCYRRPVRWLNDKQPIQRTFAESKLNSRMNTPKTWENAKDLINEIYDALMQASKKGTKDEKASVQNSAIDDIPSAPLGSRVPGRTATTGSRYQRDDRIRGFVIKQAKGVCEYCRELGFLLPDGSHYLEAHHVIALADQGADTVDNVIALCPSDHREAHYGKKAVVMENEMIKIIEQRQIASTQKCV